jgi:SAM-dependent methyltransferase
MVESPGPQPMSSTLSPGLRAVVGERRVAVRLRVRDDDRLEVLPDVEQGTVPGPVASTFSDATLGSVIFGVSVSSGPATTRYPGPRGAEKTTIAPTQEDSQMATSDGSPDPEALVERLFEGVLGMTDVYTVYMGDRLGIYEALADGSSTEAEIAAATSTDPRYLREWLEQQAVTGLIEVDDPSKPSDERRYELPDRYAEVLVDRDDPSYMAAFARMMAGLVRPLPRVLEVFRTGEGIPYAAFDADFLEGQAEMNRVQFVNFLASEWMPSLPDVHERLKTGGRIADFACGAGWSTIALARAYPNAQVHGLDLDSASIELARANAASEGIEIPFEVRDAADPGLSGRYDLVTCFEAVHDMARPVESLRGMRSLLADGGVLLIADERVAEDFTAPADEVERLMYGFSLFHCLAVGRDEQPSAATGTAMRPDTLREYAEGAGFGRVEILPIENDFWRFYRLEG